MVEVASSDYAAWLAKPVYRIVDDLPKITQKILPKLVLVQFDLHPGKATKFEDRLEQKLASHCRRHFQLRDRHCRKFAFQLRGGQSELKQ
jgi:hypothetical protein